MIAQNISRIRQTLPEGVQLLCVSKYHTTDDIRQAYMAGERDFGESRVQKLLQKRTALPDDIHWHFIGHLQTNKVKQVLPFVHLIHGADSVKLLQTISRQQAQLLSTHNTDKAEVAVLLEVKIAQEATKYGFTTDEVQDLFHRLSNGALSLPHVRIAGLMGMASHTTDTLQIRHEFSLLHDLFEQLRTLQLSSTHADSSIAQPLSILSMGMSDDYPTAIACGSNLVRIGSAIFEDSIA